MITFLNESAKYRAAREKLLQKEIELRRAMEAVAAARRELPPGGAVREDYVFQGAGVDGAPADLRLSELFAPGKDSLVIYNFMFPRHVEDERPGPGEGQTARLPLAEGPCPSCTALLDQWDAAIVPLEAAGVNFVVVAKTSIDRLLNFARDRGWKVEDIAFSPGEQGGFKEVVLSVGGDLAGALLVEVSDRHARALRREPAGGRGADP